MMCFLSTVSQARDGIETTRRNRGIRSSLPVMKGLGGGRKKREEFQTQVISVGISHRKECLCYSELQTLRGLTYIVRVGFFFPTHLENSNLYAWSWKPKFRLFLKLWRVSSFKTSELALVHAFRCVFTVRMLEISAFTVAALLHF